VRLVALIGASWATEVHCKSGTEMAVSGTALGWTISIGVAGDLSAFGAMATAGSGGLVALAEASFLLQPIAAMRDRERSIISECGGRS
jgi:hypothetical protein